MKFANETMLGTILEISDGIMDVVWTGGDAPGSCTILELLQSERRSAWPRLVLGIKTRPVFEH